MIKQKYRSSGKLHTGNRRGRSLIEVLMVVSLLVFILSQATTMITSLLSLNTKFADQERLAVVSSQYKSCFEADVQSSVVIETGDRCELLQADGRNVSYSRDGLFVVREVRKDDKVLHRDRFDLQLAADLKFRDEPMPRGTLVTMAWQTLVKRRGQPTTTRDVEWMVTNRRVNNSPIEMADDAPVEAQP